MRPSFAAALALVVGYGWGHAGGLVLASVAVGLGYITWIYFCPFVPHRKCKGTGRNIRGTRYFGRCKTRRCQAGTVQRVGAKSVHRIVRATIASTKREK